MTFINFGEFTQFDFGIVNSGSIVYDHDLST